MVLSSMARVLAWFSCGDASAVAAKLAVDKYGDHCEVVYCDTFAYEHPDNRRFFDDVELWLGHEIKVIRSRKYRNIYEVFTKRRFLSGVRGALCTTEMKKIPRQDYAALDDVNVFGYTVDEGKRIKRLRQENPELIVEFPLYDAGLTKRDCHRIVRDAGIELPMMYRLGYKNNNCIGCVKGQSGYWNKIRRDFPEVFDRMARLERELNAAICKREGVTDGKRWRERVFLDELPPDAGRYDVEPDIECGVLCISKSE